MSLSSLVRRQCGLIHSSLEASKLKQLRAVSFYSKRAPGKIYSQGGSRNGWILSHEKWLGSENIGMKSFGRISITAFRWHQIANYSTSYDYVLGRLDPDHPFETLRGLDRYSSLLYHESDSLDNVNHSAARRFIDVARNSKPIAPVADEMYKEVVDELLASLSELHDDEFVEVMAAWTKFPLPKSSKVEPHASFMKALDDECLRRAVSRKNWICPVNFILADVWRSLGTANLSVFHWQFVKQLLRKIDRLDREELVRFCLCFSIIRTVPKSINLYAVEYNILRHMTKAPFDSDEAAIACKALYKAKSSLLNKELMKRICEAVVADQHRISDSALIPIIKSVRLASHKVVEEDVLRMIQSLIPHVNNYSVTTCAYLSFLVTRGRVKSDELFAEIVNRVNGNLEGVKLRDLEYLMSGLSLLNVKCDEIYQQVVQALRNIYTDPTTGQLNGALNFPGSQFSKSTPKILNSLAYAGMFPHDLTSMVLSKEFLDTHYGNSMYYYKYEILLLNENILREQNYTGNTLSPKTVGYLTKCHMEWIAPVTKRSVNPYQRICRTITDSFSEIVKDPALFYVCNILPHCQNIEIVFCKNDRGELVPVPDEFKNTEEHLPKLLSSESAVKYFAILLCFWDDFVYKSDELLGHTRLMHKQIERLGYTPYVVGFWDWKQLETPEMQKEYLRKLTNL